MNTFVQETWDDLSTSWEYTGEIIFTDCDWNYITEPEEKFVMEYDYEGMILIRDNVVDTLKVMFPPFTRDMFDLLGSK